MAAVLFLGNDSSKGAYNESLLLIRMRPTELPVMCRNLNILFGGLYHGKSNDRMGCRA
jgi:hypothetical protein